MTVFIQKIKNKGSDGFAGLSRLAVCSRQVWAVVLFLILGSLSPVVAIAKNTVNERSYQYDKWVIKYARQAGVPVALVYAIIRQESAFQSKIGSKTRFGDCTGDANPATCKGAYGLMQLMPATGERFGVAAGDRGNPAKNIMGGTKYLSWLLKRFKGDVRNALAAYNAGPGKVDQYNGIPPYRETRNYVKKVMGYYRLYAGLSAKQRTPVILKNKPVIKLAKKQSGKAETGKTTVVIYNNKRVKMGLQQALVLKRSMIKKELDKKIQRLRNKRKNRALQALKMAKFHNQKLREKRVQLAKARALAQQQATVRVNTHKLAKADKKQNKRSVSGRVSSYHPGSRIRSITLAINDPNSGYSRVHAKVVR